MSSQFLFVTTRTTATADTDPGIRPGCKCISTHISIWTRRGYGISIFTAYGLNQHGMEINGQLRIASELFHSPEASATAFRMADSDGLPEGQSIGIVTLTDKTILSGDLPAPLRRAISDRIYPLIPKSIGRSSRVDIVRTPIRGLFFKEQDLYLMAEADRLATAKATRSQSIDAFLASL